MGCIFGKGKSSITVDFKHATDQIGNLVSRDPNTNQFSIGDGKLVSGVKPDNHITGQEMSERAPESVKDSGTCKRTPPSLNVTNPFKEEIVLDKPGNLCAYKDRIFLQQFLNRPCECPDYICSCDILFSPGYCKNLRRNVTRTMHYVPSGARSEIGDYI